MPVLSNPISATHAHILNIMRAHYLPQISGKPIRILDVGCGDGQLVLFLARQLPRLFPDKEFEFYGLEVYDHAASRSDFREELIANLLDAFPETDWQSRVVFVRADEAWPFEDAQFDAIISNQVVEHVMDLDKFFSNVERSLCFNGISAHLFPLNVIMWEGHLDIPFVHWIGSHHTRCAMIALLSRFGMGKYKVHKRALSVSVDKYSTYQSDYLHYYTNYKPFSYFVDLAKKHRLRLSLSHTRGFYLAKLSMLIDGSGMVNYRILPFLDFFLMPILTRLSSVTLMLEKRNDKVLGDVKKGRKKFFEQNCLGMNVLNPEFH